jgi:CRISPR system Cascade subunit CasC
LFDTELTSGLFYGYVVVDLGALLGNLGGDAGLAAKVAEHLVHLVATVSPGAKKGSTAPYAYAEHVLVEAGRRQPRTLANAFRAQAAARTDAAEVAMTTHLQALDEAYGVKELRRHLSITGAAVPGSTRCSLDELAAFASAIAAKSAAPQA